MSRRGVDGPLLTDLVARWQKFVAKGQDVKQSPGDNDLAMANARSHLAKVTDQK
jgi:hypothetical protein